MMGRLRLMGVMLVVLFIAVCPDGLLAQERYTVKQGDSLYTIAKSFGITVEVLKAANRLEGNHLKPKQILLIPNPQKKTVHSSAQRRPPESQIYIVKQGENLYSISKKTGLSVDEIKRLNRLQTDRLKVGQSLVLKRKWDDTHAEEMEEIGDMEEVGEALQTEPQLIPEPLGKWKDSEERNLFVRVVKTFLGVPYKLGGATLKGMDCSAFVKKIFGIFNVELPRTVREQLRFGKKVERDELEEGDLVFFKTHRANGLHVGIYIGDNQFVHASYRSKEVRVDTLETPYFNQRFIKGVRLIELEKES